MDYVGRIFNFFDSEDCHSTVAGPPSNERDLDEPLESADGLTDSYHSMCAVNDSDDDENERRVFLDIANEGQPKEDITDQDNMNEVITDRENINEVITDQYNNTDRDITDQNDTDGTNIASVKMDNVSEDETMKDPVSPNTESLVLVDSVDRQQRNGPVREDFCEDESILMSAIAESPIDHHQPATSALEHQIDFGEGDNEENAMYEEDAISSAGSCTATAGSSIKTIDSEETPEEYSRMYLPVDQLRLMNQQRQDAMREHLNMAWQSSLNYILSRNAVELTKVIDLLGYSRWEAARLRTEVEMLKTKLHDQACSQRQLLKLLKVREREVDDMNNDIHGLGAECAELMDEVSNLKKTKDQENHMIECLMKEKAALKMQIQELEEGMKRKQMEHESVVNQLTQEKSELQAALLKIQAQLE